MGTLSLVAFDGSRCRLYIGILSYFQYILHWSWLSPVQYCLSHNFRTVQSVWHIRNETGYGKECEKETADRRYWMKPQSRIFHRRIRALLTVWQSNDSERAQFWGWDATWRLCRRSGVWSHESLRTCGRRCQMSDLLRFAESEIRRIGKLFYCFFGFCSHLPPAVFFLWNTDVRI